MKEITIELTAKQIEYRNSLQSQIKALEAKIDGAFSWWISEAGYSTGNFTVSPDGSTILGSVPETE
jgi:hypothetical protein